MESFLFSRTPHKYIIQEFDTPLCYAADLQHSVHSFLLTEDKKNYIPHNVPRPALWQT